MCTYMHLYLNVNEYKERIGKEGERKEQERDKRGERRRRVEERERTWREGKEEREMGFHILRACI